VRSAEASPAQRLGNAEQRRAGDPERSTDGPSSGQAVAIRETLDDGCENRRGPDRHDSADGDTGQLHRRIEGQRVERHSDRAQGDDPPLPTDARCMASEGTHSDQGLQQATETHRGRADGDRADVGREGRGCSRGSPQHSGDQDQEAAGQSGWTDE